jgi:uncharacterized protein (DUF1501 family)
MERRHFLMGSLAASGLLLGRDARAAGALRGLFGPRREGQPILVLVELSGGNDGLNTLVPHGDDAYYRARRVIAHPRADVLDLDGHVGLAPQLKRLRAEYDEGRLAVVQGAGYPQPNRSHFKSMEIWHTGRASGRESGPGWIGHLANELWKDDVDPNRLVHVGSQLPYSLQSRRHPAVNLQVPENYRWAGNEEDIAMFETGSSGAGGSDSQLDFLRGVMQDARASSLEVRRAVARYRPVAEYPDESLAQSLAVCAALIDAQIGCQVLSVQQRSYDTHANQLGSHANLLEELDASLAAFTADLRAKGNDSQVCILAFSEFGRRVSENASGGTDHGTAGPMFVLGSGVRGGVHGVHPSLTELDERGDMTFGTDFRSVYGTIAERHFGVRPERVLGARYPSLELLPPRKV